MENIITLPIIPMRGPVLFPHMVINFEVGRKKSIKALEEAMEGDQLIFLTSQTEINIQLPTTEDIKTTGCIAKIVQMFKQEDDDIVRVLVEGIERGEIYKFIKEDPYFEADILKVEEKVKGNIKFIRALKNKVLESFETYIIRHPKMSTDILAQLDEIEDPGELSDIITANIPFSRFINQVLLEEYDPVVRLKEVYKLILESIEVLDIENKIGERVSNQLNKLQKEHYLREKLKAIQKELGDDGELIDEVEEYREKLLELKLPEKINEKIQREIDRLLKTNPASPESSVIRNYIDWVLNLPWNKSTDEKIDINYSKEILDEDHYGLEKVKERILEFMSIRKLSDEVKGPILCLVGPPGVGKTSIAKSIARSMNRNFTRISLGGIRDEAEIRGHRRTYVGSIPGRIINSLREAKSSNPVFLLDEIDKLASDFRGDPASALLEVLDPEQNNTFTDNYLEIPFDLSKVMFLTTANSLHTIPRPLLDRMEVIHVSGYTEYEKFNIAKEYLIDKKLKENGLKKSNIRISDSVIKDTINYYTRESGVRNLEREIGKLFRKSARRIVEEDLKTVSISSKNLSKYLGRRKYRVELKNKNNEIGIVRGLAWTSVGGDTLSIEVNTMKGKGKLVLTGHLGNIMKESASAGLSYVRTVSDIYGIDEDFYNKLDIHIHIPEGATPKDGPSAGLAMATAMISALSKIPVNRDIAMTGEITLRGKALPIGGVKEKVLAAKRAMINTIILPIENKKDLEDISDEAKKGLDFKLVEDMSEVLKYALVKDDKNDN